MRLIKKEISSSTGHGYAILKPEEEDDIWHLYNLILPGDSIKTKISRKVIKESSTGAVSAQLKTITSIFKVISLECCQSGSTLELLIKGRNIAENDYMNFGQFHTIKIFLNEEFSLSKKC